jgi:poly(3-hydroxybutyrate) depolymerase
VPGTRVGRPSPNVGEVTSDRNGGGRRALPEGSSRLAFPGGDGRWLLWQGDASGDGGPLLLCLHGRAEGAIAFARTTAIGPAAASAGFRVAIPQGGGMVADWDVERDVDAISRLTDGLLAPGSACVVVGMSQGARLAAALLSERPDRFSGLAAVAGVPGPVPAAGRAHPRLYVHGDLDAVVPVREVEDHVATVAAAAGCGPGAPGGPVEGIDQAVEHGRNAATTVFPHPGGSDITLVLLAAGGHVWPGAAEPQRRRFGTVVSWPATTAVLAFARRCVAGTSG